jgi:hypothetical protein
MVVGETSPQQKFALSFRLSGEQKAQSCDNACLHQLRITGATAILHNRDNLHRLAMANCVG